MIDYVEAIPDLEVALIKHFKLTKESLETSLGKTLIGDILETFVRHNYYSIFSGRGIELDEFARHMASAFHEGCFSEQYALTKDIQEACFRVLHCTPEDADPEEEDAKLMYLLETFLEEGLSCNEDELFAGITGKEWEKQKFLCLLTTAPDKSKDRYLLTEIFISDVNKIRSMNFFDKDSKFREFIKEIIFSGFKY